MGGGGQMHPLAGDVLECILHETLHNSSLSFFRWPVRWRPLIWDTKRGWTTSDRTLPKFCSCWGLMRGYSPGTISPRTASSSTKVGDSWGGGGGEYIYTIIYYRADMESTVILKYIETRGSEHYTHTISQFFVSKPNKI